MTAAELDEKARQVIFEGSKALNFLRISREKGALPASHIMYPLADPALSAEEKEKAEFSDVFVVVHEIIGRLQEAVNG